MEKKSQTIDCLMLGREIEKKQCHPEVKSRYCKKCPHSIKPSTKSTNTKQRKTIPPLKEPMGLSSSFSNDDLEGLILCPHCSKKLENIPLFEDHLRLCPDRVDTIMKTPITRMQDIDLIELSPAFPELGEEDPMEKKYPFLYEWKKRDLTNFFDFPKEKLVEIMGKDGFNKVEDGLNSDQVRKVIGHIMAKIDRKIEIVDGIEELPKHIKKDLNPRCNPVGIFIPKTGDIYLVAGNLFNVVAILEVLQRMGIELKYLTNADINNSLSSSLKNDSEVRISQQIEIVDAKKKKQQETDIDEARTRIVVLGENREEIVRDLADKLLPKTHGGPGFTKNQALILKYIHRELQKLIKDFRNKLKIPLRISSDFHKEKQEVEKQKRERNEINSEEIEEYFPEILNLLDEKEIAILITESSIAKSSLKIITKRLSGSLHINQRVTSTSLKNILSKTLLP